MTVDVKICGIDRKESVDAAAKAGAKLIGFVFYSDSPRYLTSETASLLISRVPDCVMRVGLFVNPTDQEISDVLELSQLDYVQLHGEETPDRVRKIKTNTGLKIIKAIKVSDSLDLSKISSFEGIVDLFIFDAEAPSTGGRFLPGGNARSFDWHILEGLSINTPWLLAGGLNKHNVKDAIRTSGAKLVDVSSGVEDRIGVKSIKKIKSFIEATR